MFERVPGTPRQERPSDRFEYLFRKESGRTSWFGPHSTAKQAMESFQAVHGYWPTEIVTIRPYIPGDERPSETQETK